MPIEKTKEVIKNTDTFISKHFWDIIHFSSEFAIKKLQKIPDEKIKEIIEVQREKLLKILDSLIEDENTPDNLREIYKKSKEYYAIVLLKNKEYWSYFEKLDERAKNIERFKLLIFSILIVPWWTVAVATILWKPALVLYLNGAFFLPDDKLPQPVQKGKRRVQNLISQIPKKFFKKKNDEKKK